MGEPALDLSELERQTESLFEQTSREIARITQLKLIISPDEKEYTESFLNEVFKHRSYVFRYILRNTSSLEDAKDVFQMTYLRAFRGWKNCRKENIQSWIREIAKNSLINHAKSRNRYDSRFDSENGYGSSYQGMIHGFNVHVPVPEQLTTPADGEAILVRREQLSLEEEMRKALELLPSHYRETLQCYMQTIDEKNTTQYQTMAEILGIGVGTVKSRISRAKEKLKTIIENFDTNSVIRNYLLDNNLVSNFVC